MPPDTGTASNARGLHHSARRAGLGQLGSSGLGACFGRPLLCGGSLLQEKGMLTLARAMAQRASVISGARYQKGDGVMLLYTPV